MVILRPVRTKKRKNIAEIIRKNRPIAKGEKSGTLIGQIKATIPKTRVAGTIIEPIKFPRIIQVRPFLAEAMTKQISGMAFPKPTIKIPIRAIDRFKLSAKKEADLTIPSAASNKSDIPKIIFPRSFIKTLNSLMIGI